MLTTSMSSRPVVEDTLASLVGDLLSPRLDSLLEHLSITFAEIFESEDYIGDTFSRAKLLDTFEKSRKTLKMIPDRTAVIVSKKEKLAVIIDAAEACLMSLQSDDSVDSRDELELALLDVAEYANVMLSPNLLEAWKSDLSLIAGNAKTHVKERAERLLFELTDPRALAVKLREIRSIDDLTGKLAVAWEILHTANEELNMEVEALIGSVCLWLAQSNDSKAEEIADAASWVFLAQRRRLNLATMEKMTAKDFKAAVRLDGHSAFGNIYVDPVLSKLVSSRSAFIEFRESTPRPLVEEIDSWERLVRLGEAGAVKHLASAALIVRDAELIKSSLSRTLPINVAMIDTLGKYVMSPRLLRTYQSKLLVAKAKPEALRVLENLKESKMPEILHSIHSLDFLEEKVAVAEAILSAHKKILSLEVHAVLGNLCVWRKSVAEKSMTYPKFARGIGVNPDANQLRVDMLDQVIDSARWAFLMLRTKLRLPLLTKSEIHGKDIFDISQYFLTLPANKRIGAFQDLYASTDEAIEVRIHSLFAAIAEVFEGSTADGDDDLELLRNHYLTSTRIEP